MDWRKREVPFIGMLLAFLFVAIFGWRNFIVIVTLAILFGIFWQLRGLKNALTSSPVSTPTHRPVIEQSNLSRTGRNLAPHQWQKLGRERPLLYKELQHRVRDDGNIPRLPIDLDERLNDWLARA